MVILQSNILRLILLLTIYVAKSSAQEKNIIIKDLIMKSIDKLVYKLFILIERNPTGMLHHPL